MRLRIIYILLVFLFLTSSVNANRSNVVEAVFNTCVETKDNWKSNEIGASTSIDTTSPFVTIWDTELPGMSANNMISFPGIGTSYSISWEEVGSPLNSDSLIGNNTTIITFPNPGVYSISITPGEGTFHRIQFINAGDSSRIINIAQWGEIEWSSFAGAFKGCLNLNSNATDLPLLNNVTDMSEMFFGCIELDGPSNIDLWDVSNVMDMTFMFGEAFSFDQYIGSWDVGNVTTTSLMFYAATSFNQDLGNWNVANVEVMRHAMGQCELEIDCKK